MNEDCWNRIFCYVSFPALKDLAKCACLNRYFYRLIDRHPVWKHIATRASLEAPKKRARKYRTWRGAVIRDRGSFCEFCWKKGHTSMDGAIFSCYQCRQDGKVLKYINDTRRAIVIGRYPDVAEDEHVINWIKFGMEALPSIAERARGRLERRNQLLECIPEDKKAWLSIDVCKCYISTGLHAFSFHQKNFDDIKAIIETWKVATVEWEWLRPDGGKKMISLLKQLCCSEDRLKAYGARCVIPEECLREWAVQHVYADPYIPLDDLDETARPPETLLPKLKDCIQSVVSEALEDTFRAFLDESNGLGVPPDFTSIPPTSITGHLTPHSMRSSLWETTKVFYCAELCMELRECILTRQEFGKTRILERLSKHLLARQG